MIRVSTTTLENFRRLIQTDYGDESYLIASIKGLPFEKRWQMDAGTRWHKLLSTEYDEDEEPDYCFDEKAVFAARALIGPGLWEVKATRVFHINDLPITVVAQADHCHGLVISDVKTRFGPADPSDYEQSLQWRFYLAVHEAAVFRYVLCEFKDPKDGHCALKDIVTCRFWPYSYLLDDCHDWLAHFLVWADMHDLLPYLHRQGRTPEAA